MSTRIEVTNPHVNTTNLHVRRVRIETRNGVETIVAADETERAIPGQRYASRIGTDRMNAILIEDGAPASEAPAPAGT